jgi:hypothetical protein
VSGSNETYKYALWEKVHSLMLIHVAQTVTTVLQRANRIQSVRVFSGLQERRHEKQHNRTEEKMDGTGDNKKSIKFIEKLGFSMKHFTNKIVKDTALQNYNHTKCLCLQMVEKKLV